MPLEQDRKNVAAKTIRENESNFLMIFSLLG
jgi:hypothetical protein